MKKRFRRSMGVVLAVCMLVCQMAVMGAEGSHYMYSRYDGAAIAVAYGEEAAFAADYANPDETVTMYSRVDGASALFWSYEIAGKQAYYATGRQNITMYSKYDGAMITVHSYEAAGYSGNYYGEKATVTIYSTVDGASYTIWASELAAYLSVGYSTNKPYVQPAANSSAFAYYPDVPSFGKMAGVQDYPNYIREGCYYYKYSFNQVGWDSFENYTSLLRQWGFRYTGLSPSGSYMEYYNGQHYVWIDLETVGYIGIAVITL